MADPVEDTPQSLVARARTMLQERGAPMSAENLNRAMLMMRGGQDEGFTNDVAGNAMEGRNTPTTGRRPAPVPAAASSTPTPAAATPTTDTPQPDTSMPEMPGSRNVPGAAAAASIPGLPPMDPRTGATDLQLELSNQPATPSRSGAQAATIEPNPGNPAQAQSLRGGTAVTGPAAGGPGSVNRVAGDSTDPTGGGAQAALSRVRNMLTNPESMSPVDRSVMNVIMGMQTAPLREVGYGAPRSYPFGVDPPGPPSPAIPFVNTVERMNMPATRTYNPPPPDMLPPPGAAPPSLPPGGPGGMMLPGARTPTMIEPPPAQAQVGGPPSMLRLQTDRGNTGRTQDTRAQSQAVINEMIRRNNRAQYGGGQ